MQELEAGLSTFDHVSLDGASTDDGFGDPDGFAADNLAADDFGTRS
jgi:hypothetical protein